MDNTFNILYIIIVFNVVRAPTGPPTFRPTTFIKTIYASAVHLTVGILYYTYGLMVKCVGVARIRRPSRVLPSRPVAGWTAGEKSELGGEKTSGRASVKIPPSINHTIGVRARMLGWEAARARYCCSVAAKTSRLFSLVHLTPAVMVAENGR